MPAQRKLGRATDVRMSMLRGLVTALIVNGRIETTEHRAKEVKRIADSLIAKAIKEKDNFTTRDQVISYAKKDAKNRKVLESATSKNGRKYDVVAREMKTDIVKVDAPSRLATRRQLIQWLNKSHDENGKVINPVNHLFDVVAPKYEGRDGGYTRIIKLGARRGDAAEMAVIELV
ncbi:MAG: 50S ribosomal protein L17 [Clostridia bacterium]|jgi:large subunit ribosomal protein L17|nr:bL17 family ribosomal protein [Eubacteriales bacterium]MDD3866094.1 bL17 family ribosomal protein [Eubacteriales bacterium]MDD4461099.1 bL17 family ribosomal protein [Eubacteriales bacterium]NCC48300.1 50S ribosomal protein L17 [Clostridia bacterium]